MGSLNEKPIGVIGMGVVGDAVASYFRDNGASLRLYDKFKPFGSLDELDEAEIIVICVPTPYVAGRGFDASAVDEAIAMLAPGKLLVIKSTLQPGTTERLQQKYSSHEIVFQPEFLRESTAQADFRCPERQIVGYCNGIEGRSREVLALLPSAPFESVVPATTAELIKVATNAFLALKVTFANQLFDLSDQLEIDFGDVTRGLAADARIGPSHLNVFDGGYRGYGGRCLPKDVQGLIEFSRFLDAPFTILEAAQKYNEELQGLDRDSKAEA